MEITHYIGDKVMDAINGIKVASEIDKFKKFEDKIREAIENNEYDDIEPALKELGFDLISNKKHTRIFLKEDVEYILALAEDAGGHLYELVTSGNY